MKTEKIIEHIMIYGELYTIIILGLITGVIWVQSEQDIFDQRFEPEKEICTASWCCLPTQFGGDKDCKNLVSLNKTEACPTKWGTENIRESCQSWRPKNICDTEPNNEQCECDETETIEKALLTITSPKYTSSIHEEVIDDYIMLQRVAVTANTTTEGEWKSELKIYNETTCTKAHLRGD